MKKYRIAKRGQSIFLRGAYRFFAIFIVCASLVWLSSASPALATSNACPVTDGGAGDGDSTANGTIQISASTTWTMPSGAPGDYWDCTGKTILVTNNSTLTLAGSLTTGAYPYIQTDNLQIDSGSKISGDGKGCAGTTSPINGYGPTAGNVCTVSTAGYGTGKSSPTAAIAVGGGGGYGGAGGASSSAGAGGVMYGDYSSPLLYGSSGGVGQRSGDIAIGGAGGGVVRIQVSATFTNNGSVTAHGATGGSTGSYARGGGGSGGGIYITTNAYAGTGTFAANGGNGIVTGGGGTSGKGGGGRIAVYYASVDDAFTSADFSTAAATTGNGTAEAGSMYAKNTATQAATVFGIFTLSDTPVSETTFVLDATSTVNCSSTATTPSITAANLTLAGTISCSPSTLTSFSLAGTSSFTISSGTTLTASTAGSTLDFTLPAGSSNTWNNVTITGGAKGFFTINDAASISLTGTTLIRANTQWTNIVDLNIGSSSSISALGYGCTAPTATAWNGFGPDASNVCTQSTAGYGTGVSTTVAGSANAGGGGYGGVGGASSAGRAGGATYGLDVAPTLFGSSGGTAVDTNVVSQGGAGGGYIRIVSSGTLTVDGTIIASGDLSVMPGSNAGRGGGGSGGSIYITNSGIFTGVGSISSNGGNGRAYNTAGSGAGGGGRIAILYGTNTFSGTTSVAGGTKGAAAAQDGAVGSIYIHERTIPILSAPASITQVPNTPGIVSFTTTLRDFLTAETRLKVEYSEDGGSTWKDAELSSATVDNGAVDLDNGNTYQIGTSNGIDTDDFSTVTVTVYWDSLSASNNGGSGGPAGNQTDIQVRVTPYNGTSVGDTATSSNFAVDNATPSGLGSFVLGSMIKGGTASLTWTAVTDDNFNYYEIWYGTNSSDVANRTGTATQWSTAQDSALATATTAATAVTGLNSNTLYYFKIFVRDDFGNESTAAAVSGTTIDITDWVSYQPVVITNSGGALTYFQVRTLFIKADFTELDTNCNDLLALAADLKTEIDFWVESCDSTVVLWIEVPAIAASGTTTVYLAYNNTTSDTSRSSKTNTFLDFIDEDDSASWADYSPNYTLNAPTTSAGFTYFSDPSNSITYGAGIALNSQVEAQQDFVLETRWQAANYPTYNDQMLIDVGSSTIGSGYILLRTGAPIYNNQNVFGYVSGGTTTMSAMGTFVFSTIYRTKVEVIRSSSINNQYVYSDAYSLVTSHANNTLGTSGTTAQYFNIWSGTTTGMDMALDFAFFRKYAATQPTVAIGTAPNTPSITSPSNGAVDVSINPLITGSPDVGTGTQTKADWQISDNNTFSDSDCSDTNIVWCSMADQTNLTSITPAGGTGTFAHALSGLTSLASNVTYYVRTRHTNPGGNSAWSSSISFTTVSGVRPVASNTSINVAASAVTLTENTTTTVTARATVSDNDGCSDISNVSAKFYRTDIGAGAGDDENNHYTVASCTQDVGSCGVSPDTTATYTCSFSVQYYADPTDASSVNAATNWTAQITPIDGIGSGTVDSDTIEMNTLAALDVTASIAFGTLTINNHTGATNQVTTVTNTGNVNIDTLISGTNMACSSGSIPVANIKYRPKFGFSYGTNDTSLSTTPTEVDMDVPQRTAGVSTDTFYWGLNAPISGVGGSCSATLTFTPVADPLVD